MMEEVPIAGKGEVSAGSRIGGLVAVIATATLFGFTYSLSAASIAIDLAARGISDLIIGANAATHALGTLAIALLLPRMTIRFGIRPLLLGALVLSATILMALPALPFLPLWFLFRLGLGMASEILFVLSETWANSLSMEATRGRTMATYTACLATGLALGPVVLTLVGGTGILPYTIGAAIALMAALVMLSNRIRAPQFDPPHERNPIRLLRLAPIAMSATVLNAAIESAGLSFLAVYAMRLGWPESGATGLMSVMMVGAIVLQIPVGWLADHVDRRKLLILLGSLASFGALIWPLAMGHPWAIYVLLFCWGGAFVGIYTVMLAVIGSRFANTELVAIYAGMGLMWGLGAFLGPVLAGLSMQIGTHGLAGFAASACSLFTIFAIMQSRKAKQADHAADWL